MSLNYNDYLNYIFASQLEFKGFKGEGTEGFIAIDDVTIMETPEACQLSPPEAKPVTTTTSTTPTTTPTTPPTPVPSTEPPNCKILVLK